MKHLKNKETITSVEVAELSNKRHTDLLRSVRSMEKSWAKVNGRSFALVDYEDKKGEKRPMYLLTKIECLYIATKFNDEARAKLILRWDQLEKERVLWSNKRAELRQDYRFLTDAIMYSIEHPKSYHFSNENFMLYDIVLNTSSRKYKKENNIKNLRDFLDSEQIERLYRLQQHDTTLIEMGYAYNERKEKIKDYNQILLNRKQLKLSA